MKPTDSVTFDAATYSVKYELLSRELLYMDRTVHHEEPNVTIDVFGRCWSFSIGEITRNQVAAERYGRFVPVEGLVALFIPSFSLIEWHLEPGTIQFEGVFSVAERPSEIPDEPFFFHTQKLKLPTSLDDLWNTIVEAKHRILIGKENFPCPIARKTRHLINETYHENTSCAEVAERLHFSHAVMTRYFTRCYGIPPVVYRNKLRVMDAQRLMLMHDFPVWAAAQGVGFPDLRQFNRCFKKEINTTPSRFRLS